MKKQPIVILEPKNKELAQMIQDCADGKLPYHGENSLHSKVTEMGYKTTGLYELVMAAIRAKHQ